MQILAPVVPYRGTRKVDAFGGGEYGAPRRKRCRDCKPREDKLPDPDCESCNGTGFIHYTHKGLDFIAVPGDTVIAPISGKIVRIGQAYARTDKYKSIHIMGGLNGRVGDQLRVKLLYVTPGHDLTVGATIWQSKELGTAQDIARFHSTAEKRMTNHVHTEVMRVGGGQSSIVDPAVYLAESVGDA